MPDNPHIVALLKEYKDEVSVTRTEVGRMVGMTRGQIAGICNRHDIKPWPKILKHVVRNRSCQFPIGRPGTEEFHLCGKRKAIGHSFLCEEHRGERWKPVAKVLSFARKVARKISR